MSYRPYRDRTVYSARRREQVRHLIRSVGVELDGDGVVPFFVETDPGKFQRNERLESVAVRSDQLRTIRVDSDVPAKIPADGLPTNVLERLIEIGSSSTGDL